MMRTLLHPLFVVVTTLLLTGAGLAAESFDVPRAELLAMEHSESVLPPSGLVQAIEDDLTAIETAHPELAEHVVRPPWKPGVLMVGLTPEANEIYKIGGTVQGIEDLNHTLGGQVKTHHHGVSLIVIGFNQPLNPLALIENYRALESVTDASPDTIVGDGDDLNLLPEHGIYIYLTAWGDCRSGCINKEYRYFQVNGEVTELTPQDVAHVIGFQIQTQPEDMNVNEGGSATLSFELAGGNDTLLKSSWVFWQRLDRQTLNWASVSTFPTLTLTNISNAQEGVYAAQIRHTPTGLRLLTQGALVQVDDLDPVLWRRAFPMEDGWAAAWIGFFYKERLPWIYLAGVDWFYTIGSDEDTWLWNDTRGWLWTSIDFHPWIYNDTNGDWSHGF